jgi:NADH:ubiquinone oxidoreductase subunit 4 (subunit M)
VFEFLMNNILLIILFLPFAGMVVTLLLPRQKKDLIRNVALWVSILTFIVSLVLWFNFEATHEMQFDQRVDWFSMQMGDADVPVQLIIGIDGISLLLVMLTTFMTPIAIFSSFGSIKEKVKEYFTLFLLLEVGMIGVFLSGDLFLFYVFWEVMLVPMYFLIGIWGGKERIYAAIKFVMFTMAGSLLIAVLVIEHLGWWLWGAFEELMRWGMDVKQATRLLEGGDSANIMKIADHTASILGAPYFTFAAIFVFATLLAGFSQIGIKISKKGVSVNVYAGRFNISVGLNLLFS